MARRIGSPDELSFAALRTFEDAVVRHVRARLSARFPDTWLSELRATFGTDRWARIAQLAKQSGAASLEPTAKDEFDYIGIAEFPDLFDRHKRLLVPDATNPGVLRVELQKLRVERNAVVHHRGNVPTRADAVALMNTVRHVLRALGLTDDLRVIDDLIDSVIGISPTSPTVEPEQAPVPSVELFERMFDQQEPEVFVAPLMRFFQDLADNLYAGSEDEFHSADERWEWHRGAEAVALALQDILVSGLIMAGKGGLLRQATQASDDPSAGSPPER